MSVGSHLLRDSKCMTPDNQKHLQFMNSKKELNGFKFQSDNNCRQKDSQVNYNETNKFQSNGQYGSNSTLNSLI